MDSQSFMSQNQNKPSATPSVVQTQKVRAHKGSALVLQGPTVYLEQHWWACFILQDFVPSK